MRIVFAGTPTFAATMLQSLIASEHELVAVYSQPDRPKGRGRKLIPSPTKALALEHGLRVEQPISLASPEEQKKLAAFEPDVMLVVAYGLLLPQAILDTPKYGCVNVHASLLPRWRGAAPIERALLAGDHSSGVSIMQMDAGLDTGDMLITHEVPITPTDTALTLESKISAAGIKALQEYLELRECNAITAIAQEDDKATYAKKISKAEAEIPWCESAEVIHRYIRGFNPRPVAFTHLADQLIRVWEASISPETSSLPNGTIVQADKRGIVVSTASTNLILEQLQLQGGKVLSAQQLLNGKAQLFQAGSRFQFKA